MKFHVIDEDEVFQSAEDYAQQEGMNGILGIHYRDGGVYSTDEVGLAGIELRHPDLRTADPEEINASTVQAVDYNDLTGIGMNASSFYENVDEVLTYFNNFGEEASRFRGSDEGEKRLFQFLHTFDGLASRNGDLVLQVNENSDFYDSQFYNSLLSLADQDNPHLGDVLD